MDYLLTEEQVMIRDLARQIALEKIRPVAAGYDIEGKFPWDIVKVLSDSDLFGIYIEDNARIYVEYEGGKEIMGVVVGNTGRLNIPLEERDILFLNEKLGEKARGVIEHLNFLNNKYYSALKEGIVKEE